MRVTLLWALHIVIIIIKHQFLPRDAMHKRGLTVFAVMQCLSVRPSVCPSPSWITERAAISVTTRLADLGSCTGYQQGGLLQLGSRRYSRPAAGPAAVRLECRRPFGLLSEAVRTHNPIAS